MQTTPRAGWTPRGRALTTSHTSEESAGSIMRLLVFVLGFSVGLSRFVPFEVGPFTPTFMLGILIGTLGWWKGVTHPYARTYLRWIVPFCVLAILSLIKAGAANDLANAGGVFTWLLLVPGIAVTVQDRRMSQAMLRGLIFAASVYLAVVFLRVATGQPVLDRGQLQLLGVNRNAIDVIIVWLVPAAALAPILRLNRPFRIGYVVLAMVWLFASAGRTGTLSLIAIPFILFVLKRSEGESQNGMRTVAGIAIAIVAFLGFGNINVSWLPAADRVESLQSGDRSSSDEIRILLSKKARAIADKNPWLGIGFLRFDGAYDPVIEEAKSAHIYNKSLNLPAHNTFLELAATVGYFGAFTFLAALLWLIRIGARHSDDDDARTITTGFILIVFSMAFHSMFGTIVWLPMALVLATAMRAQTEAEAAKSLATETTASPA